MSEPAPTLLTIGELFQVDRYRVPVYQRAYAWGRDEIETLLQDVHDFRLRDASARYYIGSLVVDRRRDSDDGVQVFDVIDGQQRLTTLFMLLSWMNSTGGWPEIWGEASVREPSLTFEGRDRSTADLRAILRRPGGILQDDGLAAGYSTISAVLSSGSMFERQDADYLLDRVTIIRTELPPKTNLNHYFEIMNSRGEQLEKHEIVKGRLYARLEGDVVGQRALAEVWNACSDMSRRVEAGFVTGVRGRLFGERWDRLDVRGWDDLRQTFGDGDVVRADGRRSLAELIETTRPSDESRPTVSRDDDAGRYGSIIDFPNFLLHALRVHRQGAPPEDTPLDDKQLLEQFDMLLADDVGAFVFSLLRTRYLFDNYVIKTDRQNDNTSDESNWVIKSVFKSESRSSVKLSPRDTFGAAVSRREDLPDEPESDVSFTQRQLVLLQSMYQVTDSRRLYKNFLFQILDYLSKQESGVDGSAFVRELHRLAEQRLEQIRSAGGDTEALDAGTGVQNFVFNLLDYKIWHRVIVDRRDDLLTSALEKRVRQAASDYVFRYRRSVEHFYPRHPDETQNHDQLPPSVVDSFGNLCIMTPAQNSQRSNLMPLPKAKQYSSFDQSLKFRLMADVVESTGAWAEKEIAAHRAEMLEVLDMSLPQK